MIDGIGLELDSEGNWEYDIPKGINGSSLSRLVNFCQLFSS